MKLSMRNTRTIWTYPSGGKVWFDDKSDGSLLMWQDPSGFLNK